MRGLGRLLMLIGAGTVAAALERWWRFWSEVALLVGDGAQPPSQCLYEVSPLCAAVTAATRLIGTSAYEPLLLWTGGLALTTAGFLIALRERVPDASSRRLTERVCAESFSMLEVGGASALNPSASTRSREAIPLIARARAARARGSDGQELAHEMVVEAPPVLCRHDDRLRPMQQSGVSPRSGGSQHPLCPKP